MALLQKPAQTGTWMEHKLRFLIIDTYYPAFLSRFYAAHSSLKGCHYQEQWQTLMNTCFGTADFYSSNLKKLGHEAEEVVANCEPLQRQWAREHGIRLQQSKWPWRLLQLDQGWLFQILTAQVKQNRPDVLYIQNISWTNGAFLNEVRPYVSLIIGQIAYPLPNRQFKSYDLILTSFPHYVPMFRDMGVASEYFRIGFEPRVLDLVSPLKQQYQVTFVGAYSAAHRNGTVFLEQLAGQCSIDFWGYGVDSLAKDSPIRKTYHGEAWGLDMYRILEQSKITLNRHIDVAGRFANNMRLYEATGVGTLLVTERKDNLSELFEPSKEVVAYQDAKECAELVKYYLEHEQERAAIARAGQQRTLCEHTYYQRMQELLDIVNKYL